MKQNKEQKSKKPRPNKYQVAAKTGEVLQKAIPIVVAAVGSFAIGRYTKNDINFKK